MEVGKIDFLDASTIMFLIMTVFLDVALFFSIFTLVLGPIGLMAIALLLGMHYILGLAILFFFFGKAQGLLSKAILVVSWLLPLPTLTFGIILMVVASNKIGAFLIEQGAIQVVAIATAGAGEALEGAAVVAEGGQAIAEGAQAVGEIAEGAEALEGEAALGELGTGAPEAPDGAIAEGGTGAAGAPTTEAGGVEGVEAPDEFQSPEERNPMENLQEELNEPQEDRFGQEAKEREIEADEEDRKKDNKAVRATKKVFDVIDRADQRSQKNDEDEEEEAA